MATALHQGPKLLLPSPRTKKTKNLSRAETKTMEREITSFRSLLTAEECPLELSLATLGAQGQGSSSSAGEGTVVERRGAATGEGRPARTAHAPSMSALYAELRALLPNLPSGRRATKDEILDAAVERVKVLEDTAAVLEAYRGARAAPPRRRNEVAVVGPEVCFSARLPAPGSGALRRVLEAFDRRGVQVLAATLERHGAVADAVVTVTAAAAPPEVLEMIRADIACIR